MAHFSHYPLQQAVFQTLAEDATLTGLVTGVFDRTPQGTAFPYVTIGDADGSDWSSKTTTGMQHDMAIHAWSREGGRKQAASIMERLHTLLHQANLSVSGQTLVMMRFTGSSILLENDGWTYHGTMRFRALLQAN